MSDILVTSPFQPFTLPTQFKAVFNGYIYCGTVDAVDPSVSQVQVYLVNESGDKVPVAQPLRTNAGGYLVYNGQPAKYVTNSNHSLLVQDQQQVQVWYAPDVANVDPQTAIEFVFESLGDPSGASLIGFIQDGSGAIPRDSQGKMREKVSVFDFGAVGDGVADDTTAIQIAIDHAIDIGAELHFNSGTYKITTALTVDSGLYDKGVILVGEGRNTTIHQTGAGQDAIIWSSTQFLQNSGIRDMRITCSLTSGHCINIVYGCTTNFFTNVELEQNNPAKSVIYGDHSVSGGGVYDTKFSGGSWYCSTTSTAPGVNFKTKGTIFNENIFENLRCYNAKLAQFFKIEAVSGSSYWLINNVFRNINFEICNGGGVYFQCFKNSRFEGLSFWDAQGEYTNHLIDSAAGAGIESTANTFINCGRNGDTLASGVNDIRTVSGQDFTYVNCYTQNGDSPRYDFNGKRGTVIGTFFGAINNGGLLTILSSVNGVRFPNTLNGASLNYYDEGNWIATLGGSTTDPTVPVTATGKWTRIGRQVHVSVAFLNATTTGASGQVLIRGLPFATHALAGAQIGLVGLSGIGVDPAIATVPQSSTVASLVKQASMGATILHTPGTGQFVYLTIDYVV